jgi:Kef-type K+ transport system membrane component KefB
LPAIVLEVVLGIVIGPQVLGWVSLDTPIQVMSLLGLAFLLFLAGLEIDYERLRDRPVDMPVASFAISFGFALLIGLGLHAVGFVRSSLLIGIALSSTSAGIRILIVKDEGLIETPFGQAVIAGSSIAEVATIVLLSLLFSSEAGGIGARLVLLGLFGLLLPRSAWRCCVSRCRHVSRRRWCVSRTRPPKYAFALRSSYLSCSRRWRSGSAWKRSSAPSSPVRHSNLSTGTKR